MALTVVDVHCESCGQLRAKRFEYLCDVCGKTDRYTAHAGVDGTIPERGFFSVSLRQEPYMDRPFAGRRPLAEFCLCDLCLRGPFALKVVA